MIIGIVNYDLSNIFCVCSAVNYLGFKHKIINKPEDLKNVDKIILPGVGAFGDAINNLKKSLPDDDGDFTKAPGGILDLRAIVLFGVADLMDLNFIPFIRTYVYLV